MKKTIISLIVLLFVGYSHVFAQQESSRIQQLRSTLNNLQATVPGLSQKVDFSVNNIELPVFVRSVANTHKVNISVEPELRSLVLSHNFSNASVQNVLLYLCKEHSLTIDFIGNILSIKKYKPELEKPKPREIPVTYDSSTDHISLELNNDSLSVAFKKITNVTGKNLVYAIGLGTKKISGYIQNKPFASALDKLAFSNNLMVTKTKDDYYLFEDLGTTASSSNNRGTNNRGKQTPRRRYKDSNFYYKVTDSINKIVEVDFENVDIAAIIKDIGYDLNIGIFTSTPLTGIGKASIKTKNISYDKLLAKILEDTAYTFKKENNLYFIGKSDQSSLRSIVTVPLLHRSIEIMSTPTGGGSRGGQFSSPNTFFGQGSSTSFNNQSLTNPSQQRIGSSSAFNSQRQNINTRNSSSFGNYNSKAEALVNILPKELIQGLEVKTDIEHNSFIVSGDTQKIEKFKEFIKKIDKPVPVILIEVMILEVSKSATVDTGVEFGLGEKPVTDSGQLFPSGDVTLGAKTINKIIGGFNGFGSLNVGKVVPNFYAKIKAMETNGNVKIRSTPKLSTLNGHQALLSNGRQSYYAVTRRDIIGSQNPQTTEVKNYVPINADLSIALKPMVAGDNQITMSINVVQSSFNGERIDKEAPPGIDSREFTSIIRVKDQDVVILGGLEEKVKNDSGSGVPFLARIPIIKWFFSRKTRIDSKKKLSVLIKPTIIR
ncbi:hypothetical protein [Tenacibaculum sp. 190524A02b]|uniref:General secretion pathway protein GspD n=1 Tax=Tenacibaculum vairaonense TaxID=3137860 RepID=A0ABM9PQD4_9FLAO